MLLQDCPVGSFVRLVSFKDGHASNMPCWNVNFEVREHKYIGKYVIDGNGDMRGYIFDDPYFQFEIVAPAPSTPNTITLNGKTYKLKPHTEPRLTVIDGVTYEMEEI